LSHHANFVENPIKPVTQRATSVGASRAINNANSATNVGEAILMVIDFFYVQVDTSMKQVVNHVMVVKSYLVGTHYI
jgi:hypothetical protein